VDAAQCCGFASHVETKRSAALRCRSTGSSKAHRTNQRHRFEDKSRWALMKRGKDRYRGCCQVLRVRRPALRAAAYFTSSAFRILRSSKKPPRREADMRCGEQKGDRVANSGGVPPGLPSGWAAGLDERSLEGRLSGTGWNHREWLERRRGGWGRFFAACPSLPSERCPQSAFQPGCC